MPTEREKLEDDLFKEIHEHYECDGGPEVAHIIADYILANYTPKPAVPGDGELRERVCTLLNQAVEDLGLAVLFRDQDPVDTAGAGDKNPAYYWTDKFMQLFASQAAAAFERGRIAEAKTCEKARRHDVAAAKTHAQRVQENVELCANADMPAEWTNSATGKKLYNDASVAAAQERAELTAKLEQARGWLAWVESGGGHIDRRRLKETISELEALAAQPKEQQPTKDMEER